MFSLQPLPKNKKLSIINLRQKVNFQSFLFKLFIALHVCTRWTFSLLQLTKRTGTFIWIESKVGPKIFLILKIYTCHQVLSFFRPVTLSLGKSAFTSGSKSSSSYSSISPTEATPSRDKWIITLNASLEPNFVLQIYSSVREQVNNGASYFQMAHRPEIYLVLKFLINFLLVMIFWEVNKCVK